MNAGWIAAAYIWPYMNFVLANPPDLSRNL